MSRNSARPQTRTTARAWPFSRSVAPFLGVINGHGVKKGVGVLIPPPLFSQAWMKNAVESRNGDQPSPQPASLLHLRPVPYSVHSIVPVAILKVFHHAARLAFIYPPNHLVFHHPAFLLFNLYSQISQIYFILFYLWRFTPISTLDSLAWTGLRYESGPFWCRPVPKTKPRQSSEL